MFGWVRKQDWGKLFANGVYLALLAVLWPHTKWMFQQFEATGGAFTAGLAAFAFEAAIFVLTKKQAKHIEQTPSLRSGRVWLRKAWFRYGNAYTVGLLVSIAISSVANWAHAVEFGADLAIYDQYGIDPLVTSLGFGGVLSFVSLLFARVLADVKEGEHEADAETAELRKQLREQGRVLKETEARLVTAEGAARLVMDLAAEDKARRIVAAKGLAEHLGFQVPQSAIAALTDTSASYVSEVLKGNGNGRHG